jgi:hypothetical protein
MDFVAGFNKKMRIRGRICPAVEADGDWRCCKEESLLLSGWWNDVLSGCGPLTIDARKEDGEG